jgi:hypothetical protein
MTSALVMGIQIEYHSDTAFTLNILGFQVQITEFCVKTFRSIILEIGIGCGEVHGEDTQEFKPGK